MCSRVPSTEKAEIATMIDDLWKRDIWADAKPGERRIGGLTVNGQWRMKVKHACGEWVWEDDRYCSRCGGKVERSDV